MVINNLYQTAYLQQRRLVGVGRLALVLVGPRILVPCVLPIVVLPAADRGDPFVRVFLVASQRKRVRILRNALIGQGWCALLFMGA